MSLRFNASALLFEWHTTWPVHDGHDLRATLKTHLLNVVLQFDRKSASTWVRQEFAVKWYTRSNQNQKSRSCASWERPAQVAQVGNFHLKMHKLAYFALWMFVNFKLSNRIVSTLSDIENRHQSNHELIASHLESYVTVCVVPMVSSLRCICIGKRVMQFKSEKSKTIQTGFEPLQSAYRTGSFLKSKLFRLSNWTHRRKWSQVFSKLAVSFHHKQYLFNELRVVKRLRFLPTTCSRITWSIQRKKNTFETFRRWVFSPPLSHYEKHVSRISIFQWRSGKELIINRIDTIRVLVTKNERFWELNCCR